MSGSLPRLLPRHDRAPDQIDVIETHLYDHNRAAIGRHDGLGLGFAACDSAGREVASIAGYSWEGMAELKMLWVAAENRGSGLARALIEAFVEEARRRGCAVIWVMSFTFQAPGLYERCGFVRVAELADFPPGHGHVVLRLDLAPARCEAR